jgi:hypothetical protein
MKQSYNLTMSLGESYIEGRATSENKEYIVNIQGGATCLILPSEFEKVCDNATLHFFTEKGNKLKLETKVEYSRDWIQIYDDFATLSLSSDLPIVMTIEYGDNLN